MNKARLYVDPDECRTEGGAVNLGARAERMLRSVGKWEVTMVRRERLHGYGPILVLDGGLPSDHVEAEHVGP